MKIVFTRAINETVAEDTNFAKFVLQSIRLFMARSYGHQHPDDLAQNIANPESAMGSYIDEQKRKIWVRREQEEHGKDYLLILYPSDY